MGFIKIQKTSYKWRHKHGNYSMVLNGTNLSSILWPDIELCWVESCLSYLLAGREQMGVRVRKLTSLLRSTCKLWNPVIESDVIGTCNQLKGRVQLQGILPASIGCVGNSGFVWECNKNTLSTSQYVWYSTATQYFSRIVRHSGLVDKVPAV